MREREWWEKEDSYFSRSNHATEASLWKYIPKKYHEAVDWVSVLEGYWIYLAEGWRAYDHAEDCGIIHEYNIADLKEAIKTIEKCEV